MVGDHLVQPIIACLGFPIAGNPTQFVLERAIRSLGLDMCVITAGVRPENFVQAVQGAKAMRFAGLALMVPFQESSMELYDRLEPAGTPNPRVQVAKREDNQWIGGDLRGMALSQAILEEAVNLPGSIWIPDETLRRLVQMDTPSLHDKLIGLTGPTTMSKETQDANASSHVKASTLSNETPEIESVEATNLLSCIVIDADRTSLDLPFDNSLLTIPVPSDSTDLELSSATPRGNAWKISTTGLVIDMTTSTSGNGKAWAERNRWRYLNAIDFQAYLLAEMITYWSNANIKVSLIREWLDEYYQW